MEKTLSLLNRLRSQGIRVWIHSGDLKFSSPPGALSDQDIAELRQRKNMILHILSSLSLDSKQPKLTPRSTVNPVPLTFQQRWLWHTLRPRFPPGTFEISYAFRLRGKLNLEHLERSLLATLQSHEALRTRFIEVGDSVCQWIDPTSDYALVVDTATVTGIENADIAARDWVADFFRGPVIDPHGPLFRIRMLALSDEDHIFAMVIDHMISDGISMDVFFRKVIESYENLRHGRAATDPPDCVQYPDYAAWQQKSNDYWISMHHEYWTSRLDDACSIRFSFPKSIEGVSPGTFGTKELRLGSVLTKALRQRALQERVTLPLVVFAASATLVSMATHQLDFVMPVIVTGRSIPGTIDSIGYFAHILHLRIQLTQGDSLRTILQKVTVEYLAAYEHDDFGRVLASHPSLAKDSWFQFDSLFEPGSRLESFIDTFRIEPFARSEITPLELDRTEYVNNYTTGFMLVFTEESQDISVALTYRADLLCLPMVKELSRNFQLICENLAINPDLLAHAPAKTPLPC